CGRRLDEACPAHRSVQSGMRKVVIHSPGGYDKLKLEEQPDPTPGEGEVVVETAGIGVNYADCCVRLGVYASAKKYVGWPITPGFEFAGTVNSFAPSPRYSGERVGVRGPPRDGEI